MSFVEKLRWLLVFSATLAGLAVFELGIVFFMAFYGLRIRPFGALFIFGQAISGLALLVVAILIEPDKITFRRCFDKRCRDLTGSLNFASVVFSVLISLLAVIGY